MYQFLFNPMTRLAVMVAVISTLIISTAALAAFTPQLIAAILLTVAVLMLLLTAFQSGRLPRLSSSMFGPGGGGSPLRRDPVKLVMVSNRDIPPVGKVTLSVWPIVRQRTSAALASFLTMLTVLRRRDTYVMG